MGTCRVGWIADPWWCPYLSLHQVTGVLREDPSRNAPTWTGPSCFSVEGSEGARVARDQIVWPMWWLADLPARRRG